MSRRAVAINFDEELENKNRISADEESEDETIAIPQEDEEVHPLGEELAAIEEVEEKEEVVIPENLVWTYLRTMGRTPLLTPEKELALLKEVAAARKIMKRFSKKKVRLTLKEKRILYNAKKAYAKAKSDIVTANLRLVVSIARRYQNRGLHLLDLIQEGNIGAMRAVDKFDHTKGFKFSTYATWWIRQGITRAIFEQARTIRLPVHITELINKIGNFTKDFTQKKGRKPTPEEIAEVIGISIDKVNKILKAIPEPVSLERPIAQEEKSEKTLKEFLQDTEKLTPHDEMEKKDLSELVNKVLSTLTPREEKILKMRFGIGGDEHTLEETGNDLKLTRERIRQIEIKALRKLRHLKRSEVLRNYA
ncbi:MAG: sigma-70 family RNA polymerase sigma factor [Nitrospirota bacterium]